MTMEDAKKVKELEKALKKAKAEVAKVTAIAKNSNEIRATISRALELLDNCAIAVGRDDEAFMEQAGGAAREFLDKLSPELQALFRDWHSPGAEGEKSRLG